MNDVKMSVGHHKKLPYYQVTYVFACRFLFPGVPEDGGIIPEPPASPSKCSNNPSIAEQG